MKWEVVKLWDEYVYWRSVVTVSRTKAWAVAPGPPDSKIARLRGKDWILEALPYNYAANSFVWSVDADSEGGGWIAGQAVMPSRADLGYNANVGLVLHNSDTGFGWIQTYVEADPIADGLSFWSVCALNDNCVWAGGQQQSNESSDTYDAIYFWDGNSWTRQFLGPVTVYGGSANITDISALSPTSAWATGGSGDIYHWDGVSWTTQYTNSVGPRDNLLFTICATDATHVWAGGQSVLTPGGDPGVLFYDGSSWALCPMLVELWVPAGVIPGFPGGWFPTPWSVMTDLSAISSDNIWAVGMYFILRFDRWESGSAYWRVEYVSFDLWSGVSPTVVDGLMGISVLSDKKGWAVGYELDYGAGTTLGVFIGQLPRKELGMLKEGITVGMLG